MLREGVGMERAAERHVEHLRAPADPERGQALGHRLLDEAAFEPVALRIEARGGHQLAVVELGPDIVAAADDQAVDGGEIGGAPGAPAHGAPPGEPDVERHQRKDAPAGAARRGDGDERASRHAPRRESGVSARIAPTRSAHALRPARVWLR